MTPRIGCMRRSTLLAVGLTLMFGSMNCGKRPVPAPPVTSLLIYDVTKTFSANCGPNVSCIDFDGVASFNAGSGTCTNQTFGFDNSSWMSLVINTQFIYPGTTVNVILSETNSAGQNIQNPWTLVLQPTAGPQDAWPFTFRVVKQAPTDLQLQGAAPIQGHYTLSVLGSYDVTASTIEIHAEKTVTGAFTHLCGQN